MEKVIHVYTDGASRGNPGKSAIAFVITDEKGNIIKEEAKFIGECTNNIAEYSALILALNEAKNISKKIVCFSDSKLMINQLIGAYKVKKSHIKELFAKVKKLEKLFESVEYRNVPRTNPFIKKADYMVNKILDKFSQKVPQKQVI